MRSPSPVQGVRTQWGAGERQVNPLQAVHLRLGGLASELIGERIASELGLAGRGRLALSISAEAQEE